LVGFKGKGGSFNSRGSMITYLYIIKSGAQDNAPIKIGVAVNVEKRLDELQTGNPQELIIMYKIPMNSRAHAYMVEARLHRQFYRHRIRGEWFKARVIHKIKVKELLEERKHEKLCNDDETEMIYQAVSHI